jgi:hypothetical protein
MMLTLLRRDPLIGAHTMKLGVIMVLNALVTTGLVTFLSASPGVQTVKSFVLFLIVAIPIWLSILPLLLTGRVTERCLTFDMAMPIPARRLWLAHTIALLIFALTFIFLTCGILHLLYGLISHASARSAVFPAAWIDLVLPLAATYMLAVVILQSGSPSLCRIPRTGNFTLLSILLASGAPGLASLLALLPGWATAIPLGAALALAYRTYRSVPPAFALIPFHPGEAPSAPKETPGAAAWTERAQERLEYGNAGFAWFLLRLLHGKLPLKAYAYLFFYPLLALLGITLSGFAAVWKDLELPQLTWLFLTACLLLSFLPAQIVPLRFLLLMPISSRRIFAFIMLPGILIVALGYGLGSAGKAALQSSRLMVKFQKESTSLLPTYESRYPQVRVPAQHFEIAWNGQAPENSSSWGETHPARSDFLYAGSRIAIFTPFSTPADCTPQFAALQISRALEAVYGISVPYQQVLDRYLEVKDNRAITLKGGGALLLQDFPGLAPRNEIPLFPIFMLVIGVLWLLMAALYFRTCRATITEGGRKAFFFGMLAVVLSFNIAPVITIMTGFAKLEVVDAFLRVLIRYAVDQLPGGAPMLGILCLLPLLAAYGLALSQFRHVELVPARTGETR